MSNFDPTPPNIDAINPTPTLGAGTAQSVAGVIATNVSRTLESVSIYTVGDLPITDYYAPKANYSFVGSYTGNGSGADMRGRFRITLDAADIDDGTYTPIGASYGASFDQGFGDQAILSVPLVADNNLYGWQAIVVNEADGYSFPSLTFFKTAAIAAHILDPTVSAVTGNSATIGCVFYANTFHSLCYAALQYKKSSSIYWVTAGNSAPCNGYAQLSMGRDLVGLTNNTTYDVRLALYREIAGGTVVSYSSLCTFATVLPNAPQVITGAASNIGVGSAVLIGSLTCSSPAVETVVSFLVGRTSPPGESQWGAGTYNTVGTAYPTANIINLTADTLYYYRIKSQPTDTANYPNEALGSILSFTTPSEPDTQSKEDDMLPIQTFDRKYKTDTTIYFVVPTISPDSNTFYTGAACWADTGESQISKNGAEWADTAHAPAVSTAGGALFKLELDAGELDSDEVYIKLHDVGAAVRDILLRVRTHMELGSVDIDAASGAKTNTSALKLTGYGSGAGLEANGGATGKDIDGIMASNWLHVGTGGTQYSSSTTRMLLGTTSSDTADLYNGCLVAILSGTGAGQARIVLDYVGGTYPSGATNDGNHEILVDTAWVTVPTSGSVYALMPGPRTWEQGPTKELNSTDNTLPTSTSGYGKFLQLLFQRFAFKVTQDPTTQKWFQADGTELFNRPVSDTGGVQTVGTLAQT
jgi:hypothetical protein